MYLVIAIVAAFLGPLVINWLYQAENPIFITEWDAVDVLEYYGTILGAIISVLVILITITNEHQKIADERREEKRRIEDQRRYDNMMDILNRVSNSVIIALQELDPNLLYSIYVGHILYFREDLYWLIEMRKDSNEYLNRTRWLVQDCLVKIGELGFSEITDERLVNLSKELQMLHVQYMARDNEISKTGRNVIATPVDNAVVTLTKEAIKLKEMSRTYDNICSRYGEVIQNVRQQIMKKFGN